MTDPTEIPERDVDLPSDIVALLEDEATWAPVDVSIERAIVSAVMHEVAAAGPAELATAQPSEPHTRGEAASPGVASNVTAMPSRWKSAALGAAAALVLVAGIFGATRLLGDKPDLEVELAGTELAAAASATAELTALPEGTLIRLWVSGLPPAAPGTYYEAWLRKDADVGVSAGTFHLREGEGPIDLWAGVLAEDYPLLTVTLQAEAQTESSGQVVLKARLDESN